nr:ATP-binding protein [Terrimicrobiaceae bacterium]
KKSLRHEREKLQAYSDKDRLERRDRQLIRALGQIVYRHDLGRDWIEWDGDCEKILGDPSSNLPRTTAQWRGRIHADDLAAVDASFDVMKRTGAAFQADYRIMRSGGEYVWIQDRGLISREDSDGKEYVDGVLLDISGRKAGEAELILARDRAEMADRAKSEFLAVMSHEIRTPLNGVIGYTSLMMETALSAEQREYLDSIHFCSKSLLDLLNDILDFSKMESGKMELERRPFSLRGSVEEVVSLYAHLAADRKLALACEFLPGAPDWIIGDSTRLRQVLVNLVGNAVKFTEQGRIDVRVEPLPEAPGGKSFRLAVADTGIGISPDKITRLFKLFSQADSSTTRKYGGTGLGLAICSRLVDMMGGTLTVESREGEGSRFVLELPCVEPTKDEIFERLRNAESEAVSELEVPQLHVVVAEDNAVNRSLIRRILSDLGHESHMVANGRECLAAVEDGAYDMIFMDLQMPEMDGFETTKKLRELGNGIWITALTADAMPEDAERCRAAGMNDYVSKPFTKVSIRRAMEKFFRNLEQEALADGTSD